MKLLKRCFTTSRVIFCTFPYILSGIFTPCNNHDSRNVEKDSKEILRVYVFLDFLKSISHIFATIFYRKHVRLKFFFLWNHYWITNVSCREISRRTVHTRKNIAWFRSYLFPFYLFLSVRISLFPRQSVIYMFEYDILSRIYRGYWDTIYRKRVVLSIPWILRTSPSRRMARASNMSKIFVLYVNSCFVSQCWQWICLFIVRQRSDISEYQWISSNHTNRVNINRKFLISKTDDHSLTLALGNVSR